MCWSEGFVTCGLRAQLGKFTTGQDTRAYKVQGMQFTIGMGGLETMMRRIDDWIAGAYPEEARVRVHPSPPQRAARAHARACVCCGGRVVAIFRSGFCKSVGSRASRLRFLLLPHSVAR